jgi:hypothetical protein
MLGNYRVAAQLVASRVVLSSTELVSLEMYIPPRSQLPENFVSMTKPVAHASLSMWHQEWYVRLFVPQIGPPISRRIPDGLRGRGQR